VPPFAARIFAKHPSQVAPEGLGALEGFAQFIPQAFGLAPTVTARPLSAPDEVKHQEAQEDHGKPNGKP